MSTRCQIGIYEKDEHVKDSKSIEKKWWVLLYRHSDGYPGFISDDENLQRIGVIPDILPFINKFIEVRGYDAEYMGACLIAYLKHWHCGHYNVDKKLKNHSSEGNIILNGFEINPLSHGISKAFHGDIEFFYAITPSAIKVYEVEGGWDKEPIKFTEIESHNIVKSEKYGEI